MRRVTQARHNEGELLIKQEQDFNAAIDKLVIFFVDSPIEALLKAYKLEQVEYKPLDTRDAVDTAFLAMQEIKELLADEPNAEVHLQNAVNILKGHNMKMYKAKLGSQLRYIAQLEAGYKFTLPKDNLQLQKLGQILGRNVVRDCYMTQEAFGQIKNKDKRRLFKPAKFASQSVTLETKTKVQSLLERQKDFKARGIYVKETLVWPDRKELAKSTVRLAVEDRKTERQKALYLQSMQQAVNLRDHIILQRVLSLDPNKKTKINALKSIWKVKVAEMFYSSYLKPFFRDIARCKALVDTSSRMTAYVKAYVNEKVPNLYESQQEANGKYSFSDNKHYSFKQVQKEQLNIDLEVSKHQFATTVCKPEREQPTASEILKNKRQQSVKSQFENLQRKPANAPVDLKNLVDYYEAKALESSILYPARRSYLELALSNSRIILNFRKLVLKNVINEPGSGLTHTDIDNMLFRIECGIDKGDISAAGPTLIDEVTESFISFDVNLSMKVNLRGLENLRLRVHSVLDDKTLLDTVLDLRGMVDFVCLEDSLYPAVGVEYNGRVIPGVLQCVLVLVPKNLETAHLTLQNNFIDANFDRFMEIYKASQDYPSYRASFFTEQYRKAKLAVKSPEYLFYLNNMVALNLPSLNHQQSLICNQAQANSFDDFVSLLESALETSHSLQELLVPNSESGAEQGTRSSGIFLDISRHVLGLLSPQSRLLVHKLIFEGFNKQYINLEPEPSTLSYHDPMVKELSRGVAELLSGSFDYLREDQRHLVYKLAFEVYLLFDNNSLEGHGCPIALSRHHLVPIVRYVLVNCRRLRDEDLKLIVINQIMSHQDMEKYTKANQLMYIDSMIVYFKLLFKKLYADYYRALTNKMMSFDAILAQAFVNSFASYFETINYNIYNDLKLTFQHVFSALNGKFGLLDKLGTIGLSFGSLFDIIFALQAMVTNAGIFDELPAHKFGSAIETVLRKESRNLGSSITKMFKLLSFLYDEDFHAADFLQFRGIIQKRHESQIASNRNLTLNIKALGLDRKAIRDIIEAELLKNDMFSMRVLTLYSNEGHSTYKTKSKTDNEESVEALPNAIDEDAYFEIAEDFDFEAEGNMQAVPNRHIFKYTGCLIYLNNLDYYLIENNIGAAGIKSDLNNICELSHADATRLLGRYMTVPEELHQEIQDDLAAVTGSDRISLVKLVIVLICSYTESLPEMLEGLRHLGSSITGILFSKESGRLLDDVIMHIIDEVYGMVPVTYFAGSMHNLIGNHGDTRYCHVKTATFILETDVIDVTQICIKHLVSNTFLSGKPMLYFNEVFCRDMELVLKNMVDLKELDTRIDKLSLYLEVVYDKEPRMYTVPFKVTFDPEVRLLCKFKDPLYFTREVSERSLLDDSVLDHYFLGSPYTYFNEFTSLKLPVDYTATTLIFALMARKTLFLTVEVRFVVNLQDRPCSSLANWKFRNPDTSALVKLGKQSVAIEVGHGCFFFTLGQLYSHVRSIVLEKLDEADLFRFIKLNNEKFVFKTAKGKNVVPETFLFELAAVEEAIKSKTACPLSVIYKA